MKSNEWYTPSYIIEAARDVMGSIELDPASCVLANQTVKAERYYSLEEDGLYQEWKASTVWLNPPYGKINNRSVIELWIKKLVRAYEMKDIHQAIILTTCDSDNGWFQCFWNYLICFSNHNVHFFRPVNGQILKYSRSTQMFGTIFVYLGPNEQKFIDVFSKLGTVARRVSS